ncbi:hypothetical protein FQR65_LT13194 [Abscondita terminalis]|nr:hypothetical protein FQR65_LT13194 [Abscondita terminalis]
MNTSVTKSIENHNITNLTMTPLGLLVLLQIIGLVVCYPTKAIDLTWPFNNKTIAWDGSQKFEFTKIIAEEKPNGDWYSAKEFRVAEHAGTHLDAPYHLDKEGWKVGDIPLSNLMGNGIKVDVSNETEKLQEKAMLLPKHLIDWESRHGPLPENAIVFIYFNWGRHYLNPTKYLGGDSAKDYKFPGVSIEAAQWLVDTGKVLGVGIDTASIDPGYATDLPVHKILCKNKSYLLENVKISETLPEKGFSVTVMPMLLGEGSGGPVRIVAYPSA